MADPASLERTALFDLHHSLGAKMVPFAGYEMPVQYPLGVMKEHLQTRKNAGLFDVSHMGQIRLSGTDAALALESLVPIDVLGLKVGQQRYALFTNDSGGIRDDLMVTNMGDHLFLVVNAACKHADFAHLTRHLSDECEVEMLDRSLIALQGPRASEVLAGLNAEVANLVFMQAANVTLAGATCTVSRSGYTGEDGFEISVPHDHAEALSKTLLEHAAVEAIGLGARDSLRLEAGLCLYGHDLDEETTPVEASLLWALSKVRRGDGERPGGYPGAEIILRQLSEGATRRRVGLKPTGRAPVREGVKLYTESEEQIGMVTSGGFGPSVESPVAMGYVVSDHKATGTQVQALVRNKLVEMTVTKMPFSPHQYHRG